jgi:aspartate aminotransferase-like enzyme
METYPIPMAPGPVVVPPEILDVYKVNYGSADLEPEFLALYNRTEDNLRTIMATRNRVIINTAEGMYSLWSALKSCLRPGDRVLAVATGVFGFGIGDMAKAVGASVRTISIPYNQTISDWAEIEHAIADFRPAMITAVHCETPSGTLNPLEQLGELKERYEVPLLYVDAVASIGGAPVLVDEWHIDLCLGGSQKVLSAPPSMSFLSVSERAMEITRSIGYVGYDAILPFENAQRDHYFPNTPYWHGVAALNAGAELILKEGLENSFARHADVARFCREYLVDLGFTLYPDKHAVPAPTVTAVNVPEKIEWSELDRRFRGHGLVVGGSYGPLTGKVFRLGHMGSQAHMELLGKALDVIENVMKEMKS